MTDCVVGMVTCSSRVQARKIARAVLGKKLAACVNITDGVESHYWWQGKLERAGECLLLIKTTRANAKALAATVKALHSYQVPEVIFLPVTAGERRYIQWVRDSVKKLALGALTLLATATARADPVDQWIRQLSHPEEEMRAEAAERLAAIGGPRAEKQFREMLDSANPEHRQMAVVGLLQLSDAEADLQRVRLRLKDENPTVRWSAVLALGQTGRPEVAPWLEEVEKSDPSDSVREAAAEALSKLRSRIPWLRSMPEALRQARQSRKPVLAYFFVRGSELCQRYEQAVLADQQVVEAAQQFVCVRLNAETQPGEVRRFDVRGAPTVLLLDAQGNETGRVAGLVEPARLLAKIAQARQGRLTFGEARRLALRNPADVQANWKVAETYLDEGRQDLAEPHLRNVIAHDEQNRFGYTDNAMFALGFALGSRGQHAQAAYCMEQLLARWPDFPDADKALYCLGLSQLALGERARAESTFQRLMREHPASPMLPHARAALEKLNAR
jgi:periplasmic divalent cation tolerance protein